MAGRGHDDDRAGDVNGTPAARDRRRRRGQMWALLAAGLVAAGLVVAVIVNRVAQAREQDAQDAAEPTAWENRAEMDQVLVDTARLLGISGEVQPQREAP